MKNRGACEADSEWKPGRGALGLGMGQLPAGFIKDTWMPHDPPRDGDGDGDGADNIKANARWCVSMMMMTMMMMVMMMVV